MGKEKQVKTPEACPACKSVPTTEEIGNGRHQVICDCGMSGPALANKALAIHEWDLYVCGVKPEPPKTLTLNELAMQMKAASDDSINSLTDSRHWPVWAGTQDGHLRPIENIEYHLLSREYTLNIGEPIGGE